MSIPQPIPSLPDDERDQERAQLRVQFNLHGVSESLLINVQQQAHDAVEKGHLADSNGVSALTRLLDLVDNHRSIRDVALTIVENIPVDGQMDTGARKQRQSRRIAALGILLIAREGLSPAATQQATIIADAAFKDPDVFVRTGAMYTLQGVLNKYPVLASAALIKALRVVAGSADAGEEGQRARKAAESVLSVIRHNTPDLLAADKTGNRSLTL